MPIADLIITQITAAGYKVESETIGSAESYTVRGIDPATGESHSATASTLTDAAALLAAQLNIPGQYPDFQTPSPALLTPSPALSPPPPACDPPVWLVPASFTLISVIFILDLLTPGIDLSIFYLMPLYLAAQSRMRIAGVMLLYALVIVLIYVNHIEVEERISPAVHGGSAGLINRAFATLAIAACAAMMVIFRKRDPASEGRPCQTSQRDAGASNERRFLLLAAVAIAGTFIADMLTPVSENLPIFYFAPLALVALAVRPLRLWPIAGMVWGLMVLGYLVSPHDGITAHEVRLALANRMVTGGAVAVIAFMFHLAGRRGSGEVVRASGQF